MTMKPHFIFVLWAAVLCLLPAFAGAAGPLEAGQTLADIRLPVPTSAAHQEYLGLSGGESFTLGQVEGEVVLIEIFSMYCPFCQAEAPKVNALYEAVQKDPALGKQIKLIGIGAGNSSFEVGVFGTKYGVAFPLFPDRDFALHEHFGQARTPFFAAVRVGDGSRRVLHTQLGGFKSAEGFVQELRRACGL